MNDHKPQLCVPSRGKQQTGPVRGSSIRSGGPRRLMAVMVVVFMVMVSLLPVLSNVGAVSQRFSRTYDNDTNVPVPEGATVTSDIDVDIDVVAARVDVLATIPCGRRGDLVVTVLAPDGTSQVIWSNPFDNGANLNLNVNDLVNFRGEDALGTWSLQVRDWWVNGLTATIDYWEIEIYYDLDVVISSPSGGSAISGTYTVEATVANADTVELWIDGAYVSNMVYNGGTSMWEYDLDTTGYTDGMHNLQIIAEDSFGNRLADQMGVEVDNYDIFATIVSPADGSTVSGSITVWLNVPSYATLGSLAVDGNVVSTSNSLSNFGGTYYFDFALDTRAYSDGDHPITGTAYDPENNFAASSVIYTFNNYQLSCSIADPSGGATISGTYIVKADVPATAVRGELYVDGNLDSVDLTRDGSGQYTFSLDTTNHADGNHNLEVRAYNALGDSVPDAVNVDFDNWAITTNIVWPTSGTTVSGSISVWATAPAYSVAGRLFVDDQLYTTLGAPSFGWYSFSWDTTGVSDGIHTIKVEVEDPDGNVAADSESPTVNNYDITVTITAPTDGDSISGTYTVRASVPDYSVRGELYVDDQLAGIDITRNGAGQYTYSLDARAYDDGRHIIKVIAYDPDDATATDTVWVDIDNYDITVTITTPADGADVSGNVLVRAQTQAYAIKGELFIDGQYVAQDTTLDGANRYSFQFDSKNYKDGSHDITVRVFDPDGDWNLDSIRVNIDNYDIYVTITDPSDNDDVSGTIPVSADVPAYAVRGELYIDGEFHSKDTTISGGEYQFSVNTKSFSDGQHTLTVLAVDPDGNNAVDTIRVNFDNWDISATIIWPTSGTYISGDSYTVWVQTQDYATRGELYVDGELAETLTSFFIGGWYMFSLDTEAYKDGFHSLSVRCYDPDDNFAADTVSVIVDNYDITVTITTPTPGQIVSGSLTVTATVPDYAVLGECYLDDQLVDTDTTRSGGAFDFSIDTTLFSDTSHTIKVIVYDPESTTAVDTVTVVFDNWDISVNIFSPGDGSTVDGTQNILATVPTYATRGELFIDDEIVDTDTTVSFNRFDFSVDTTNYMEGIHTIKVRAYDPDGLYAVDTISLIFDNYDLDVTITSPTTNTEVNAQITVIARVDDTLAPFGQTIANSAKVYVDNQLVTSSSDSKTDGQSYTFVVDTRGFNDGNHMVRVEAANTLSGESASSSIPLTFDNTPPALTNLNIDYLNGLTAVRASGDKVVIIGKAVDATSGVNMVSLDATNIGGGGALTMFDDGNHNDGESGDDVYGSDPIDASGSMGYHRVFVTATDDVGNSVTKSIGVAIDDHKPLVTNTYIIYPVGQSAAKLADEIRVIANVVDTTVYVDVVLVIDTSGSMSGTPITKARTAAKGFVDEIDPNDRSALYSFNNPGGAGGNSPKQEIAFTTNKANVKNKIDGLTADDWTPLYDTIWAAIQYGKTSNNLPVVVVLTDGVDCLGTDAWGNCNQFSTRTLDEVKDASIPVFTIGLDPGPGYTPLDEAALKEIAETSNGGGYYYAPTSDDLADIYAAIAAKVEDLEVGGISEVVADLSTIGAGTRNLMYDDGNHGDGLLGDNVFGSNLVQVNSLDTDALKYYVNATDVGGNKATGNSNVLVDNTLPTITDVKPVYQMGEWWAGDGDTIMFTANVTDTGNVGGVMTVYLDATNIGGSNGVDMHDDGQGGDTSAGDDVYTSDPVTVSTGLRTGIFTITVNAVDIAANTANGAGNIYIDNHRPMTLEFVDPSVGEYIEDQYIFKVRTNNVDAINSVELKVATDWYTMSYNALTSYYEIILDTTTYPDDPYDASLKVTDIAGKTNLGPQGLTFFVDNNAPFLVLNHPTDGEVVEGIVDINTTGTRDRFLKGVYYKVDDLPEVVVSVPWNTTMLVDGEHTLEVYAIDHIGHLTSRTIKVIVDNGNPEAYFVTPTGGEHLSGVVDFKVKATDLVMVVSVALTGAVVGPMEYNSLTGYYEAEVDTTLIADGLYAVGALVTDIAGHSLTVPSVSFNVDNDDPVLTVVRPVNGDTLTGEVTIEVNASDGPFDLVSLEWRVEQGQWTEITNYTFTWNTTTYQDGYYDLHFRAVDNLGREAEVTVSIVIDNHAPSIEITSPVNNEILEGRYLFKVHSYDTVGVDRVTLEIVGVNNYTILNTAGSNYFEIEVDTTTITDGTYTIAVRSEDVSGFVKAAPNITIMIDNNDPDLIVYSPMNGEYISGINYSMVGYATDVFLRSIEYNIDGFGTRPINQTIDTTFLAEGEHTIEVIATDEAGHVTSKLIKVIVDNQDPSISSVSPQGSESVSGKYTFRVRAEDANGIESVTLIVGNSSLYMFQNSLTGYFEVTRDTSLDTDGERDYTFSAKDRSGRVKNITVRTRIDNTAPQVTILGPGEKAKGIVKFRVQVDDPTGVERVLIRIGGGDWRDMRHEEDEYIYRWKTTEEDNGDQPFDIKVIDDLGNEEIFGYNLVVNNPSSKTDYTWLWIILVIMLVVALVAVAVGSRASGPDRSRVRERAHVRRMAEEEDDLAAPGKGLSARKAKGGDLRTGKRELGTAQHRATMRKLESEDIVVRRPDEDEVSFLPMDEGPEGVTMTGTAVAVPLKSMDDLGAEEDEVDFLDEEMTFDGDDEVSFHDDDEVSFHEDAEVDDEVSFHDDDEVTFDDDDDVEFLDDDDDVEFLDDEVPPPGPPVRTPRVPLTPRSATATQAPAPAVGTPRPTPTIATGTLKGIDDLLASGPSKGTTPKTPSRPSPGPSPKKKSSDSGSPLEDVIGDL